MKLNKLHTLQGHCQARSETSHSHTCLSRLKSSALVLGFSFSLLFPFAPLKALAAEKNDDTIKIGVATSQSGDFAQYGLPSLQAARLAAEQINANGGVLGKKLVIIPGDDQCKPELATNVATKLASDNVNAVIGHICSGSTKAALPIYTEQKIIVISPASTNAELTQSGNYPYFFRTIASDDKQAKLGVELALDKLKAQEIAIIHDKGDYGKTYAEYAKKFIEDSGKAKVILFEGITPGQVDYSSVLQKVRNSGAQALIYGGYHPEASKLVRQMSNKGIKVPFISSESIRTETFVKLAGSSADGVYAAGTKDHSALPLHMQATEELARAYKEKPGNFYFEAYAGVLALVNAFEKAGTTDPDKVVAALRSQPVNTPIGEISFDKDGEAEGVGFTMYQVKNGKFVPLD